LKRGKRVKKPINIVRTIPSSIGGEKKGKRQKKSKTKKGKKAMVFGVSTINGFEHTIEKPKQ